LHDSGARPADTILTHRYRFTNQGTEPLEILDIEKSCGCTTATASAELVAPGEEGLVEVTLDLHGRHGPHEQTVTVLTNDPFRPAMTLYCQGFAERDLFVSKGGSSFTA